MSEGSVVGHGLMFEEAGKPGEMMFRFEIHGARSGPDYRGRDYDRAAIPLMLAVALRGGIFKRPIERFVYFVSPYEFVDNLTEFAYMKQLLLEIGFKNENGALALSKDTTKSAATYEGLLGRAVIDTDKMIRHMYPFYGKSFEPGPRDSMIVFADDMLKSGAFFELADTLRRYETLSNINMLVYARNPADRKIFEDIISYVKPATANILYVTAGELKTKYDCPEVDTECPDELKELDCLLRYATSKGMGNGNLLGIVRGRVNDMYEEEMKKVLAKREVPLVSFESAAGVYSFNQALMALAEIKKAGGAGEDGWLKFLKPIEKVSDEIMRAFEAYVLLIKELEMKA
jgi:hypothetical protein